MELKKILSELKIANDINNLSLEELQEKYYKDEETYNDFVKDYANYFCSHCMYQLRAADHYDKLIELFKIGNKKYQNDDNIAYVEAVLNGMNVSAENYRISGTRVDDKYEALYLFNSTITPSDCSDYNYKNLLKGIYNGGLKYSECSEDSINDLFIMLYYKFKNSKTSKEDVEAYMEKYTGEHNMMNICNNKDFLYFANYMISQNKADVDNKFIVDVKAVIRASKFLDDMGYTDKDFDKDEYNKLAQFTLKNIAKAQKKLQKREDISIKRALKLIRNGNN
jgi:hypothetical protein